MNASNMKNAFYKKYLFSVDIKFQSNLNDGNISEDLLQVFKEEGYLLSQSATVKVKEKNRTWVITDKESKENTPEFTTINEESTLKIYKREKSVFKDFIGFFQYLRSILSQETYEIILDAMNRWDKEWQKYQDKKREAPSHSELSDLELKLHGILVESIKATELLLFQDRILLAGLSVFVILGLGIILLLGVWAIFQILASWLLSDLTFPVQLTQTKDLVGVLKDSLVLLGPIGVPTACIGRFCWQLYGKQ